MFKEKRLERILDIISSNPSVSRDGIEALLAKKSYEIGIRSEEKVKKVLEGLSFIEQVRRTERNSQEDKHGRDIVCYFSNLNSVSVQVKSSASAIQEFIKRGNLDHITLMNKKLILINGMRDEDFIKQMFLKKLFEMDEYWTEYKGKSILPPEVRRQLL